MGEKNCCPLSFLSLRFFYRFFLVANFSFLSKEKNKLKNGKNKCRKRNKIEKKINKIHTYILAYIFPSYPFSSLKTLINRDWSFDLFLFLFFQLSSFSLKFLHIVIILYKNKYNLLYQIYFITLHTRHKYE